ncbi:RNA helicase, partial [Candidatus Methylomirabilis limnetica]
RTDALTSFKRGRCRVLVATDVAARGIDVEGLGLVVNFDVPQLSEDYIHRVGRTGRMDATGEAYTLVSPNEEDTLRAIERAIGTRLPRQKVPEFNYAKTPTERFEVPLADRIAAIRTRKADERVRAKANVARRATSGITAGPAASVTAGQHPTSPRAVRPHRVTAKPFTGKSFSRPVSGRVNGTAGWRSTGSTTEPRSVQGA